MAFGASPCSGCALAFCDPSKLNGAQPFFFSFATTGAVCASGAATTGASAVTAGAVDSVATLDWAAGVSTAAGG